MEKEDVNKKEKQYYEADKYTFEDFKKSIPKELRPTDKLKYIFGGIFVIVLVIGLFTFPLGSMMSGNTEFSFKIGIPFTLFELSMKNPEILPLKLWGLFGDIIIYIIIAYMIDVAINAFMSSTFYSNLSEKKKQQPKLYNLK